jgi:hypothetical protein
MEKVAGGGWPPPAVDGFADVAASRKRGDAASARGLRLAGLRAKLQAVESGAHPKVVLASADARARRDRRAQAAARIYHAQAESLRLRHEAELVAIDQDMLLEVDGFCDQFLARLRAKLRLVEDEAAAEGAVAAHAEAAAAADSGPDADPDSALEKTAAPLPRGRRRKAAAAAAAAAVAAAAAAAAFPGSSAAGLGHPGAPDGTARGRAALTSPAAVQELDADVVVKDLRLISDGLDGNFEKLRELISTASAAAAHIPC